jgi:hypothetical protein
MKFIIIFLFAYFVAQASHIGLNAMHDMTPYTRLAHAIGNQQ